MIRSTNFPYLHLHNPQHSRATSHLRHIIGAETFPILLQMYGDGPCLDRSVGRILTVPYRTSPTGKGVCPLM